MRAFDALVADMALCLSEDCAVDDGHPLMAAVSGGADSIFLLRGLARLRDRWPLVAAVFVDHGLRDVSEELACTRATASELGVPLRVRRVSLPDRGNLQQNARRARYAAMGEEAADQGCLVCTGHTLSDQAETVLERLLRGAGLRGLSGIPYRRGVWVRPMLHLTRAEVRAVSDRYVEDPSNLTDAYLRNRIRRQILPILRDENPRVERNLAQVARAASAELELLDVLAQVMSDDVPFTGAPLGVAEALVRWRLRREAPHTPPPGRAAVELLARQLVAGRNGRVSLGGGVAGASLAGVLQVVGEEDARSTLTAPGLGHYALRAVSMTLWTADQACDDAHGSPEPGDRLLRLPSSDVTWPLVLRRWRLGDAADFVRGWRLVDGAGKVWWSADVRGKHEADCDQDVRDAGGLPADGSDSGNSLFIRLRFLSR